MNLEPEESLIHGLFRVLRLHAFPRELNLGDHIDARIAALPDESRFRSPPADLMAKNMVSNMVSVMGWTVRELAESDDGWRS